MNCTDTGFNCGEFNEGMLPEAPAALRQPTGEGRRTEKGASRKPIRPPPTQACWAREGRFYWILLKVETIK